MPLPGGTSVSHVRVYDSVGPDGLAGGTPHHERRPAPARRRRDAAVRGFAHWRAEVERLGGAQGLAPLHRAAARLVAEPAAGWRALVDADPAGDLERSRRLVELLAGHATDGWTTAVAASGVRSISLLPDSRRMGCCGTLGTVVP